MEAFEQCRDVIGRLQSAWERGDACGSWQRARSALLDAAKILSPPDVQRLAGRAHQGSITKPTLRGQLTPQLLLDTARRCLLYADLCESLAYLAKNDEAVESLVVSQDDFNDGWALISRVWPEYVQTVGRVPALAPPRYAAQTEFIHLQLAFVWAFTYKLLLPVLDTWECWLLFENFLTVVGKYLRAEPLAARILQAARQSDRRRMASLVSQADLTNPHTAGVLTTLSFLGKMWSPLGMSELLRCRLAHQVVSQALEPRYFQVAGGSEALDKIARSQLNSCFEKLDSDLPFAWAQTEENIRKYIERLRSTLAAQQALEIPLLRKKEEIVWRCQPISLQTQPEGKEDDSPSPGGSLASEPNLSDALPAYDEAVSKLPKNMQAIFRRVLVTGETPKEAAIALGYQWTAALERNAQRMVHKIRAEMLG